MNKAVLLDLLSYLPARVGPALIALLAIPLLTRLMAPAEYGAYLVALTSLSLIGSLCYTWLASVVVRFGAVTERSTLRRAFPRLISGSIVAGSILWVAIAQLLGGPFNNLAYLCAGLLWMAGYTLFEYNVAWLRAEDRPLSYSVTLCSRALGGLLLALPPLLLGWIHGYVVIFAAGLAALLPLIPLHWPWRQRGESGKHTVADPGLSQRALLAYGLPAAISNVAVTGLSMADRFVIQHQLGSPSVAIYGASYDIAERSIFFLNAMMLLSSSVMAVQMFERKGGAQAAAFLSILMRFYLLIALPISAGIAALSAHIVKALLPLEYGVGAAILPIVAASAVLVGIMHRYSLVLSFHKRTDVVMRCSIAALVVDLSGCLFLIPHLGLAGAALASALGYGSWLVLIRIAVARYECPRFPWLSLVRIGLAALAGATIMRVCADRLPLHPLPALSIAFVTGLIGYAAALLLIGEFSAREIRAAEAMVKSKLA